MRAKNLVILSLFFLIFLVVQATAPQIELVYTQTFSSPYIVVENAVAYDNGVIVPVEYVNVSITSTTPTFSSMLCIWFFNSTIHILLYKSAISKGIEFITPIVINGDLYIAVQTFSNSFSSHTYIYVFKGLKLVNTFTVNGTVSKLQQPSNLSVLQITKSGFARITVKFHNHNITIRGFVSNTTIMLNSTNITLVNSYPLLEVQLSQGILVVAKHDPVPFELNQPLNVTMYSHDGKIIWSRNYTIEEVYPSSFVYSDDLFDYFTQGVYAIVGDQLFLTNQTSGSSSLGEVNVTILGINLTNGEISKKINLSNVMPNIALLNIGGRLYVAMVNSKYVVIEEYSDGHLTLVGKVPLVIQIKRKTSQKSQVITYPNGTTITRVVNVTKNVTCVMTTTLYKYGKYLLVVYPTPSGANVTDFYYGGVITYTLNENVTPYEISNYALLLNESNNYTLTILNSNGTVRGSVNIEGLGSSLALRFIPEPLVFVNIVNPNTYYVVKVYYNITKLNESSQGIPLAKGGVQIQVYKVSFIKPQTTKTSSGVSTTVTPKIPSFTPLIIGVVVAVVIIGVVLFVLKRK